MAKFSQVGITLFLLLVLAIALPLGVSGATPTTTTNLVGDIEEDGSVPSSVDFGDAEASYIEMPSDHDDDEPSELGVPVKSVVTKAFFNSILSKASPSCAGKKFYRRKDFLNATRSYPKFGHLVNATAAKREIAAFFAHVTRETGHLCYIEEIYKGKYCDLGRAKEWPCAAGKKYYGRGPLQLTWNYNYGLFGSEKKLKTLKNPEMVAKNRVLSWQASLWFWMKNVRPVLKKGFGATIKAINGGECNGGNPRAVAARVQYYKDYCKRFRIKPGCNLSC
ncbi:unnamed protein product [Linum trigynum]|uniref:chitinase n=1 Tax=Linum trigynum TaxID=586398 RepID=A0AAV2DZD8_9ROSI